MRDTYYLPDMIWTLLWVFFCHKFKIMQQYHRIGYLIPVPSHLLRETETMLIDWEFLFLVVVSSAKEVFLIYEVCLFFLLLAGGLRKQLLDLHDLGLLFSFAGGIHLRLLFVTTTETGIYIHLLNS